MGQSSRQLADAILEALDETPQEVAVIEPERSIYGCCLTLDGESVVYSTKDQVYRQKIGGETTRLGTNTGRSRKVRVTDDGSLILLLSGQHLQLMDFETGKGSHHIGPLKEGGRIVSHSVSANGNFVALQDDGSNLQIVDVMNGKTNKFRNKTGQKPPRTTLGISNDGKHLYMVSEVLKMGIMRINDDGSLTENTLSTGELFEPREIISAGDDNVGSVKISAATLLKRLPEGTIRHHGRTRR